MEITRKRRWQVGIVAAVLVCAAVTYTVSYRSLVTPITVINGRGGKLIAYRDALYGFKYCIRNGIECDYDSISQRLLRLIFWPAFSIDRLCRPAYWELDEDTKQLQQKFGH